MCGLWVGGGWWRGGSLSSCVVAAAACLVHVQHTHAYRQPARGPTRSSPICARRRVHPQPARSPTLEATRARVVAHACWRCPYASARGLVVAVARTCASVVCVACGLVVGGGGVAVCLHVVLQRPRASFMFSTHTRTANPHAGPHGRRLFARGGACVLAEPARVPVWVGGARCEGVRVLTHTHNHIARARAQVANPITCAPSELGNRAYTY
jgi:hypothetical protein